jgi:hypothetical protein
LVTWLLETELATWWVTVSATWRGSRWATVSATWLETVLVMQWET